MIDKEMYYKTLELYKKYYRQGNKHFRGLYMSDLERIYNIPLFNNEEYNKANKEVMELYWKFSAWDLED